MIETPRLVIRPFRPSDLTAFFAIQRDPEVNRFLPWFAPRTLAEADHLLTTRYLAAPTEQFAVCLRDRDLPIGYLQIEATGAHDLGYGLGRAYWGHGYITEAARAVIASLPVTDYPFLTATHDRLNPKSGAVMQRLGMTYQYTYREQWQPKDIPVDFRLYLLNRDGHDSRKFLKYWEQSQEHFVEKSVRQI